MKLNEEAQAAANEAGRKFRQEGVFDPMNWDAADPANAIPPKPADLSPQKGGR